MRGRLAAAVREELERRKRRAGGHDLRRPPRPGCDARWPGRAAPAAAARLRARYRVVLVDEFQDTDPVQWEILRRAFGGGGVDAGADRRPQAGDLRLPRRRRLRLPQAAAERAATRATLAINWRSDQGLIDAYDALFAAPSSATRGSPTAGCARADANQAPAAARRAVPAPLRVRVVDRATTGRHLTPQRLRRSAERAREHVAADLAADVVALLSSGAAIATALRTGATGQRDRPARPHRGARAHQPPGRAGPRRARRAGVRR